MSWVTILWSMVAAASLTLVGVHLAIGVRLRRWPNLQFALTAASAAAIAFCELRIMRTRTPVEFGDALRWVHVPIWFLVVSMILFVRSYLRAGDARLAWAAIGARTAALTVNFLHPPNLNYESISRVRTLPLAGGEWVSVAEGVRSPWSTLGELSSILLVLFLIDAARDVWRHGDRRRAAVVCGSMLFTVIGASVHGALVHAGVLRSPYVISLFNLVIVAAMYSELTADVLQGADLSRRLQKSEAALTESERRMAMADAASGIGHWTFNVRDRTLWMSDRARELYGRPPDDALDPDRFFQSLDAEAQQMFRDSIVRSLAESGGFDSEYRVALADDGRRWIASRGTVERDADGRVARIRGVSLDVTRRRAAELEVDRQRNELTHLARAAMLGELSGSLAHELNQPLTAILANTQAAQRMLAKDDPDLDEIREILSDVAEQDRVAGEVIGRLRLLLTRGEVSLIPLELGGAIQAVLALARSELVNQGVVTLTDLPDGLPSVRADRVQIQQVLLNLVTNACDAMKTTEPDKRVISVRVSLEANDVRVSVTDRGAGISEEVLPRLFEPFFTTKPTGMGLGLAICRTIMDAHSGRLWAENNPEGGATVSFALPALSRQGATDFTPLRSIGRAP